MPKPDIDDQCLREMSNPRSTHLGTCICRLSRAAHPQKHTCAVCGCLWTVAGELALTVPPAEPLTGTLLPPPRAAVDRDLRAMLAALRERWLAAAAQRMGSAAGGDPFGPRSLLNTTEASVFTACANELQIVVEDAD